jgi:hypothetical protein
MRRCALYSNLDKGKGVSFVHFILFTRSTFGDAASRYRIHIFNYKLHKIIYPSGQHHDKIEHVYNHLSLKCIQN